MRQIAVSPMKISLFRNKTFSLLLYSGLLLSIGNKLYEIVLPLVMLEITHSPISMTSMRTAELLPNMFFGVFIGVIVDRVDKKRWVLWMVGVQTVLLFLLVLLFKIQFETLFIYYLIGFLLMTFNYGYFNAQVSLTKVTVPNDQLTSANAKFSLIETLVSVLAPAFSGIVFLFSSLSDGIFLTAICYFVSFVLLRQLSMKTEHFNSEKRNFGKELLEGWTFFKSNRALSTVTLFVVFLNCTMTVVSTTILFYGESTLHLTPSMLAVVLSFTGLGGIAGSLVVNKMRTNLGVGKIFGLAMLLNGIGYASLLFFHGLIGFSVTLFFIGFGIAMHTISVYTIRHEQTPSHLMGRIGGITGTIFRIGMPFTMFISGYMLTWWGPSSIFKTAFIWNIVFFILYIFTKSWKLK
ncbi:MAG: MFS transporter [Bacillota bacterium]|nr:MFS transporter [Bacillota bacterium]